MYEVQAEKSIFCEVISDNNKIFSRFLNWLNYFFFGQKVIKQGRLEARDRE